MLVCSALLVAAVAVDNPIVLAAVAACALRAAAGRRPARSGRTLVFAGTSRAAGVPDQPVRSRAGPDAALARARTSRCSTPRSRTEELAFGVGAALRIFASALAVAAFVRIADGDLVLNGVSRVGPAIGDDRRAGGPPAAHTGAGRGRASPWPPARGARPHPAASRGRPGVCRWCRSRWSGRWGWPRRWRHAGTAGPGSDARAGRRPRRAAERAMTAAGRRSACLTAWLLLIGRRQLPATTTCWATRSRRPRSAGRLALRRADRGRASGRCDGRAELHGRPLRAIPGASSPPWTASRWTSSRASWCCWWASRAAASRRCCGPRSGWCPTSTAASWPAGWWSTAWTRATTGRASWRVMPGWCSRIPRRSWSPSAVRHEVGVRAGEHRLAAGRRSPPAPRRR